MSYDTPPPPPQSPYGSPYGEPQPAPQGNSTKAVWSLVCGILGLLCCGIILGPVAIILGRQAQAEGRPGGIARAGEILGYVAVALFVIGIIVFVARR